MLEELIKANTEALTANTAALIKMFSGAAAAPAAAAGETAAAKKKREAAEAAAAEAAKGPTLQDFRDMASKIVDADQGPKLEALATKFGLERVSAAHGTDKAADVFAELKKIASAL
jgi:hypothetical protein